MHFQFKIYWLFKYNVVFIILISLVIISGLAFFLYGNFYKTIAQSEDIIVMQSEVGLDNINTTLFEKIQKMNESKSAGFPQWLAPPLAKWQDLKNPFLGY